AEAGSSHGGHETVLLVEDEDEVRKLAMRILERGGYKVLEGRNAGEALLIAERYPGEIHLLLTDVVMPRVNGRELAERLAGIRPHMRTLYMSGYTDDHMRRCGVKRASMALLQKPFTPLSLAARAREVLDAPARAA